MKAQMTLIKAPDEALAALVKHDDHAAYTELIRRYQQKLYAYLKRLTGSDADALDLVQDTFLKVYENIQSFDERKKFSSWIYRIAHNLGINHLKKHARSIRMASHDVAQLADRRIQVDAFLAGNLQRDAREALMALIEQLKPKYKDVVLLYFFEEKSYEEISDILKVPTSTVGVWLNRAKKRLQKMHSVAQEQGEYIV